MRGACDVWHNFVSLIEDILAPNKTGLRKNLIADNVEYTS